jgi:hypothetical protein
LTSAPARGTGSAWTRELIACTFAFAELVAALSLGIDLGFGQPMEHVLRQCLIALRIAERVEIPEEERAAIYYSALFVNVGATRTRASRRSGSGTT